MPADAACCATGLGATRRPRPAGASGRVTTAAISCPESISAASDETAASGVPAKTRRIRLAGLAVHGMRRSLHCRHWLAPPLGGADLLHGQFPLGRVEPVDEKHAVEMIGLVLHAAGEVPGTLQRDRLAMHVESLRHHPQGSLGRVGETGKGQAALVIGLLLRGQVKRRVYQVAKLIVDEVGENPQSYPDLRRGQAYPRRVQHGLSEVLDQPAQLGIEVANWLGRRAQDRVAEQAYRHDAQQTSLPEDDSYESLAAQ